MARKSPFRSRAIAIFDDTIVNNASPRYPFSNELGTRSRGRQMIEFFKAGIPRIRTCAAAALLLTCGTALAQTAPLASPGGTENTIKLTTVLMALPAGTPWLSLRMGMLCAKDDAVRNATGGRDPQDLPPYSTAFKTEMERAGYKIVSSDENLFDREAGAADYQVAAVVTDAHIVACMSSGGMLSPGNLGDARGDGFMKIDWQVYSPLKKQVVAHVSTSGAVKLDKTVPGGVARLITDSFAGNVRELASNAGFRAAVSTSKVSANDILLPGQNSKIVLPGSLKAAKRPIADTAGSVVTILTGSGSGSGDLVSADGYILTNAHVVGDEKQVRVRWSDGIETVAEVVRVAKDRDIALIKTSSRDREPLPIKRGPVSPGQRVYAIGSPLGKEYQGTVSSGIVSATRTLEGLRYIQSDVSITHGSSGGALLDENGSVIGIAVSGIERGGPLGLNFFIPIGDAMDFLNLEQK
jgi:serine protease Do